MASRFLCLSLLFGIVLFYQNCGEFKSVPDSVIRNSVLLESTSEFQDPQRCQQCHQEHFKEWEGSVKNYALVSPVFNAFELVVRKSLTETENPAFNSGKFCFGCHAPTGSPPGNPGTPVDQFSLNSMISFSSDVDKQGVSCHYCHSVRHKYEGLEPELGHMGDGISNVGHRVMVTGNVVGNVPVEEVLPNTFHRSDSSDYLQSSQYCGSCHDVRIPIPDAKTDEPFMRLENLFSEYEANYLPKLVEQGKDVVSCQDCHMSLYPRQPPGTYEDAFISSLSKIKRKRTRHGFTSVSKPLIDNAQFAKNDITGSGPNGHPYGQEAARTLMLQAALSLTNSGASVVVDDGVTKTLQLRFEIENTGAGHNVPAGFSQERETWVNVRVTDDADNLIYQSGYLLGEDQDFVLDDHQIVLSPGTLEAEVNIQGPDYNLRSGLTPVNLGLISFRNHFVRVSPEGGDEEVFAAHLANHMDNSHSLAPFVPYEARYDIPIQDANYAGNYHVAVKLFYRAFPPYFLRALKNSEDVRSLEVGEPPLVTDEIVKANTPVEMKALSFEVVQ